MEKKEKQTDNDEIQKTTIAQATGMVDKLRRTMAIKPIELCNTFSELITLDDDDDDADDETSDETTDSESKNQTYSSGISIIQCCMTRSLFLLTSPRWLCGV